MPTTKRLRLTRLARTASILGTVQYSQNPRGLTTSEIARRAQLADTPYLRSILKSLVASGHLTATVEPYRQVTRTRYTATDVQAPLPTSKASAETRPTSIFLFTRDDD